MAADQIGAGLPHSPGIIKLPEDVDKLNRWLFYASRPYITGRVLEMGSNNNGFSHLLLENNIPIHLSNEDLNICTALNEKYNGNEIVRKVHNIDFVRPGFPERYPSKVETFNTIIALNITKQLGYEKPAFVNARHLLVPHGILLLIFPAPTAMYLGTQENLEDMERYNFKDLQSLLGTGFTIIKTRYFNIEKSEANSNHFPHGLMGLAIAQKTT